MKKNIAFYLFLIPILSFAQNSVSITKIIESDCSNPFVKSVELYVDGSVDFSSEVQLNYMQNGGLWSDIQINVSDFGVISDKFIYIIRDLGLMQAEFPNTIFETNSAFPEFNTIITGTSTNGNDGYQVVLNGNVVSQFGQTDTDADTDVTWEHDDSVVSRKLDIPDNGLWDETHWEYSGKNSLDGETACNGGAGIEAYLASLGGIFPLQYGSGNSDPNNLILLPNTTGSFSFVPQAPLVRPPLNVFYHIPNGDITTMPILMVFHGSERDGGPHRDFWIDMANDTNFIVIAPEFSTANYPGLGDNYLMANLFDDGDTPSMATFNSPNEWTFSILDPLFDYVKEGISGTQQNYNAWGHSGGAQFLHRFVTYLPNSNLNIAVCSNAGWYTVPETGVSFPYGIDNGQLPIVDLTTAFSRKLIVHLGQNDNDPNSGLRRNAVVDAQQGIHRLERGQYYFNTSQNVASNMGVPFNWELQELSNVGHNPQLMANDALQYFLTNFLSVDALNDSQKPKIYPNPVNNGFVTILSSNTAAMHVYVYDVLGKEVKKEKLTTNTLNVSDLQPGIYIIKTLQNNAFSTQKIIIN
ncbi:T9SS type A sorting domain-containing protein [Winogradskyella sp.]|nr:T9SS type A sorting domain-containing protein [Winogradskyella sp.]